MKDELLKWKNLQKGQWGVFLNVTRTFLDHKNNQEIRWFILSGSHIWEDRSLKYKICYVYCWTFTQKWQNKALSVRNCCLIGWQQTWPRVVLQLTVNSCWNFPSGKSWERDKNTKKTHTHKQSTSKWRYFDFMCITFGNKHKQFEKHIYWAGNRYAT